MIRGVLAAAAAAAALTGCGGASADLFAVTRSGTVPGANFAMIVRDDGSVTCNGVRRPLPPELLINARGIADDLEPQVTAATALPSGPRPVSTYVVLAPGGRASFSDSSPHQPAVFYKIGQLTTQVARQVCRLPR
ncbi:MAG: hypothetical protein ACR2KV_17640 [Solirubrobacteraceae bacterium]